MSEQDLNYYNSFILVADDCKVTQSKLPDLSKGTVAAIQYSMLVDEPYRYSQPEVLFASSKALRDNPGMRARERKEAHEAFFAKSQACLRASPLAKTHGFGFHFDSDGKVALVPMESREYEKLADDQKLSRIMAMRSKRR